MDGFGRDEKFREAHADSHARFAPSALCSREEREAIERRDLVEGATYAVGAGDSPPSRTAGFSPHVLRA